MEKTRRELRLIRGVVDMVPAMLACWDANQRCVFASLAEQTDAVVSHGMCEACSVRRLVGEG